MACWALEISSARHSLDAIDSFLRDPRAFFKSLPLIAMAPFADPGCDAAGIPLQTLRKIIDRDDSLARDRNTLHHGSDLGSSIRSDRPLAQTESQVRSNMELDLTLEAELR